MLASEVVDLMTDAIEKHGDQRAYIDSDGVLVEVTEVVIFDAVDVEERERILLIR